jgi:hypothetical protein
MVPEAYPFIILTMVMLAFPLWIMRKTSVYLYLWLPIAANLLIWGCIGGVVSLIYYTEQQREIGKGLGMASAGWVVGFVGPPSICLLVFALTTIAIFPPWKTFTKKAITGPVILAMSMFACMLIPLSVFVLFHR